MRIGIVAGAMKPFHVGHAHLIEQSINTCSQTIVFTTEKDRGTVIGSRMSRAWFECILPAAAEAGFSFDLRFCISPIRETYKELKQAQEDLSNDTYVLFQGLEDAGRFNEKSLHRHCPNVKVINAGLENPRVFDRSYTMTPYGPAKASSMRDALETRDKKVFKAYLPTWMASYADQYFEILSGR